MKCWIFPPLISVCSTYSKEGGVVMEHSMTS
ncbi:hypothetical protein CGRA01v4_04567 [Colletotrichum graminicola]|nr:hypothetical protein CGRA01v4_04567 [Colletotrichum graminicola]